MLRRRADLETIGTWLFVIVVLGVGLSVALSFALNVAAEDLRDQITLASGRPLGHPRTIWASWLSTRMAPAVDPTDAPTTGTVADNLDHRADRIRELAAAGSLSGMLLMLATARSAVGAGSSSAG